MIQIGAPHPPAFDAPIELLIDCHRRIEYFFGILEAVVERARSAALSAEDRAALRKAIDYFRHGLPRHTEDEEQSLFPRLRQAGGIACLDTLEEDHVEEGRLLEPLLARLQDLAARGALDPLSLAGLASKLSDLHQRYSSHIEREEREVFPVASRILDTAGLQALGNEMAARRDIRPIP